MPKLTKRLIDATPSPSGGDDGCLLTSLYQDQQEGQSYATIAQQLNDLVAWMLSKVLSEEQAIQTAVDAGEIQTNWDRF